MTVGLSKEEMRQVFYEQESLLIGESQPSKDLALLDLHERGVPEQTAKVIHAMKKEYQDDIKALLAVIDANNKEIEKLLRTKGLSF